MPHLVGHIKGSTRTHLGLHSNKQVNQVPTDLILISNLGQKHIAEHPMHDIIDLLKILGYSNNASSTNVKRSKFLLRHRMGMVVRTNATIAFETGILISNGIAEGPLGNLKELITAHE